MDQPMLVSSRRHLIQGAILGVACACVAPRLAFAAQSPPTEKYICPPCGCAADGKEFDAPGACPECGMPLIPKPAESKPKDGAPTPPKAPDSGDGLAAPDLELRGD